MASTKNYKLVKPEYTSSADINELNNNFDKIDKGLTLDVGTSTGTGNNYILDIGSITLNSDNKGLSLRFFADKNAIGSVTINTNYNLIKANKNPIKNLKSGAPYTITYDGGTNFFLASGGGEEDSTTVTSDNVLKDVTYVGKDGEVYKGTMPNNGVLNASIGVNGSFNIPKGFTEGGKVTQSILTQGGQTITPSTVKQIIQGGRYLVGDQTILGDSNLLENNIIAGKSIFGVNGTASIQSLGGKKYADTTMKFPTDTLANTDEYATAKISDITSAIGFTPKMLFFYNTNVDQVFYCDIGSNILYINRLGVSQLKFGWKTQNGYNIASLNSISMHVDSRDSSGKKQTTASVSFIAVG